MRRLCVLVVVVVLAGVMGGCQHPMRTPSAALARGDYASARLEVLDAVVDDRGDRRYLLDRMRLGALTLADGHADAAQTVFHDVYEVLRTQGINEDRTVEAAVLHEGVQFWKGEPFEQALAMTYYGLTHASLGSWDNARAAANNALFNLRDFGRDESGERLDTHQIARRSMLYERARSEGASEEEAMAAADYLDHGYVVRESNFTLGYLLNAIANQQLGRSREAADNYTRVEELAPQLESLTEAFRQDGYDTVLIVSHGLGPQKEGYGPDMALARFRPRFGSDRGRLTVRVGEHEARTYPQVLDVNTLAADHMWNNMEDVRIAKSYLGSALMVGGLIATDVGLQRRKQEAVYAGLGAIALGALVRSGAQADTRYADVYPQRFYAVPLDLGDEAAPITLQVDGKPGSRLVLGGLSAPAGREAQLRYVRLPHRRGGEAPAWATSGAVHYANPHTGATAGEQWPYILGGACVRPPSRRVLDEYRSWGHLQQMALSELRELYRAEDVRFTLEDQRGYAGRHLLEGGRSMVAPLPGTAGFARLFGQRHAAYEPRSEQVAREAERMERVSVTAK